MQDKKVTLNDPSNRVSAKLQALEITQNLKYLYSVELEKEKEISVAV